MGLDAWDGRCVLQRKDTLSLTCAEIVILVSRIAAWSTECCVSSARRDSFSFVFSMERA